MTTATLPVPGTDNAFVVIPGTESRRETFEPALSLDLIDESPLNTRQTYDERELQDLVESLGTSGQLTPVLVRPIAGARYELAAGHRRFRAAKRMGWTSLAAIVRPMTDEQFFDVVVVENLQRANVHPLDEADAFRRALEGRYDVAALALKFGKSTAYIYNRLQLLELSPAARAAMHFGRLDLSHAIVIAPLAHEVQDDILESKYRLDTEKLLNPPVIDDAAPLVDAGASTRDGGFVGATVARDPFTIQYYGASAERSVPTLAELKGHIARHHLRDLARAPWKLDDGTLVPAAGACTTCPKRSGSEAELFTELSAQQDVCGDQHCFAGKHEAHRLASIAAAHAKHEGEKLVQISRQFGTPKGILGKGQWWACNASETGAKRGVLVDGQSPGKVLWIRTTPPVPSTSSSDATGADSSADARARRAAEEARERAEEEADAKVRDAIIAAFAGQAVPAGRLETVHRVVLRELLQMADSDAVGYVSTHLGAKKPMHMFDAPLARLVDQADRATLVQAIVLAVVGADMAEQYRSLDVSKLSVAPKLASVLGIDLPKVAAAALEPPAPKPPVAKKTAPAKAKKPAAKKAGKRAARKTTAKRGARK